MLDICESSVLKKDASACIASAISQPLSLVDQQKWEGTVVVVKLGGSSLNDPRGVLQDILWLQALGIRIVLVHGGGPVINTWLEKMRMPVRFKNGIRVTDASTLTLVQMVLCGQINQSLVAQVQRLGGTAVGLSGIDGSVVQAQIADQELGFVGEVESVRPELLHLLLEQGYIPIIAPAGQSPDGISLNINADAIAVHVAVALHADALLYLSNVSGVFVAGHSPFSRLDSLQARLLIEQGVITGGMIPKVTASLKGVPYVKTICILDANVSHVLLRVLIANEELGTRITSVPLPSSQR